MVHDPLQLPADLPRPEDDGAAAHLVGMAVPDIRLPATDGGEMRVDEPPAGLTTLVLYAYPHAGTPGNPPPVPEWDLIPGARGCTPESCGFRDHAADLRALGAGVAGVSTQPLAAQEGLADRLRLPFPLLSDAEHRLLDGLRLPEFRVAGKRMIKRVTLVITGGVIRHVFYPVFPPDTHASAVLAHLRDG